MVHSSPSPPKLDSNPDSSTTSLGSRSLGMDSHLYTVHLLLILNIFDNMGIEYYFCHKSTLLLDKNSRKLLYSTAADLITLYDLET